MFAISRVLLLLLATSSAVSHRPPLDLGTLTLDRADPAIDAIIAGIPAHLAVALDARGTIELAPAFATRLDLQWQQDSGEEIGRVKIATRMAAGQVSLGGVIEPTKLTTHDRPCCAGQDGELGPLHLPWSTVRIGVGGGTERRWRAEYDEQSGLFIPWRTSAGTIRLILSPRAAETIATASAAAILASSYGGHFTGEGREVSIAFGVSRQIRDMVLDRAAPLLGFSTSRIAVRYADFAGGRRLPQAADDEGILVRHRGPASQHDWPAIAIGRDLLDRCPAITVYGAGPDIGPEIGLACGG